MWNYKRFTKKKTHNFDDPKQQVIGHLTISPLCSFCLNSTGILLYSNAAGCRSYINFKQPTNTHFLSLSFTFLLHWYITITITFRFQHSSLNVFSDVDYKWPLTILLIFKLISSLTITLSIHIAFQKYFIFSSHLSSTTKIHLLDSFIGRKWCCIFVW